MIASATALDLQRREWAGRRPGNKTLALLADPVFDRSDERLGPELKLVAPAAKGNEPAKDPEGGRILRSLPEEAADSAEERLWRLPSSRQEALAIQEFVPASERLVALDFEASRSLVLNHGLEPYRYIHFATHGLLNHSHPELSSLVLSLVDRQGRESNGYLRTMDIFELRLSAELVTLSGCRTGLGKQIEGEGLLGLTRAFLYAGARRALASSWAVNDRATAELMHRFYRELLGPDPASPAAALHAAQISMWKQPRWRSPYYWAAFSLQGEW